MPSVFLSHAARPASAFAARTLIPLKPQHLPPPRPTPPTFHTSVCICPELSRLLQLSASSPIALPAPAHAYRPASTAPTATPSLPDRTLRRRTRARITASNPALIYIPPSPLYQPPCTLPMLTGPPPSPRLPTRTPTFRSRQLTLVPTLTLPAPIRTEGSTSQLRSVFSSM
ncbi:hypothetical protein OF83DRAFT_1178371 [Amylostereum chailletii]|nr:hypothetical protein OF83DRAFT_1178371 [Amylostereum chailletii]